MEDLFDGCVEKKAHTELCVPPGPVSYNNSLTMSINRKVLDFCFVLLYIKWNVGYKMIMVAHSKINIIQIDRLADIPYLNAVLLHPMT